MVVAGVKPDGTLNTEATNKTYNSTSAAASATPGGGLGKEAFLQLLVAEMQNQDPLEPASNTDYIAQLATFSQVEELQNVSNSMQQSQAGSLVGKVVIMMTKNGAGEVNYIDGTVERVVNKDGKTFLGVDGSLYDIADLFSVVDEKYYDKYNADAAKKL